MHKIKRLFRQNQSFLLLLFGVFFFRTAIADWNYIPSGSMEPTLYQGDYVLIDKMAYGPALPLVGVGRLIEYAQPERGDIITFVPPHTDEVYIKRVIGIPGDTIVVSGARLWVNGELATLQPTAQSDDKQLELIESSQGRSHRIKMAQHARLPVLPQPVRVPPNKYFVMGDHRDNSADSRYWGLVDAHKVIGKVVAMPLSFSSARSIATRFMQPLG